MASNEFSNSQVQNILNEIRNSSHQISPQRVSNIGFNDDVSKLLEESRRNREEIEKRSSYVQGQDLKPVQYSSYEYTEYKPHEEVVKRSGNITSYDYQDYKPSNITYEYSNYKPQEEVVKRSGNYTSYEEYRPKEEVVKRSGNYTSYEEYRPHEEVVKRSGNYEEYNKPSISYDYKPQEIVYSDYKPKEVTYVHEENVKRSGNYTNYENKDFKPSNYSETPYDWKTFQPLNYESSKYEPIYETTYQTQYVPLPPQDNKIVVPPKIEQKLEEKTEVLKKAAPPKNREIKMEHEKNSGWCC